MKKIKILFFLSVLFVFCFGVSAFADNSYDAQLLHTYCQNHFSDYVVGTTSSGSVHAYDIVEYVEPVVYGSSSSSCSFRHVLTVVDGAVVCSSSDGGWYFGNGNMQNIYYCTINLYNSDGSIFFQQTPPPVLTVVRQEMGVIPRAMKDNLAVLIPLGCLVFAILLGVRLIPRLIHLLRG